MKYFIAALLLSSSAVMATECYDDNGKVEVPEGVKIMILPWYAHSGNVVVELEGKAKELPKGGEDCRKEGSLQGNLGGC